jgi:hypothetical protein
MRPSQEALNVLSIIAHRNGQINAGTAWSITTVG